MNFRHVLKVTISESQKNFSQANIKTAISQWFERNDFVRSRLKPYGLTGDFSSLCRILKVRDTNGNILKGRTIRKLGKAALKRGKLLNLSKLADFYTVGADLRQIPFEGKSVPIYDVNRAIKFNTLEKTK